MHIRCRHQHSCARRYTADAMCPEYEAAGHMAGGAPAFHVGHSSELYALKTGFYMSILLGSSIIMWDGS